jgi:hypothetical protein
MKATLTSMLLATVLATLTANAWQTPVRAVEPDNQQPDAGVRVGTFDSRAVAIAYYRSMEFQKVLGEKRARQSKAKQASDAAAVQLLEAEGRQLQGLINRQGFGNAPIGEVIKRIEDELPKVAKRVGVDVIVSQWDVVFQKSDTSFVDVTDQLVQLFKADKKTLEVIAAIRKTRPVPVSELHIDK